MVSVKIHLGIKSSKMNSFRDHSKQALNPFSNSCPFKFFPMNTILFTLGSSGPHIRSGEPWNMSWTPCQTANHDQLRTDKLDQEIIIIMLNEWVNSHNSLSKELYCLPERQIAHSYPEQTEGLSSVICLRYVPSTMFPATC